MRHLAIQAQNLKREVEHSVNVWNSTVKVGDEIIWYSSEGDPCKAISISKAFVNSNNDAVLSLAEFGLVNLDQCEAT